MAMEREFIEKGMRRSQIDEFLASELERAGYGGMELARTPMGTEITLKAEKPGMVIGKGGKNIRNLTDSLEAEFDMEDLQIDVQEIEEPDLNARVVADKLANALERGWYFRDAGRTTLSRIMESGALGAEIIFSGKVTGARSRVEKFKDGYVKHCGEPAEEIVDRGQATAVMKLGTIGVQVDIIPPDADLVDQFEVERDAEIEHLLPEGVAADDVEVEEAETEGVAEAAAAEAEQIADETDEAEASADDGETDAAATEEEAAEEAAEADAGTEAPGPEPEAAQSGGEAPASAGAEAADDVDDTPEVDVEVEEADAVPVEELDEDTVEPDAVDEEAADEDGDEEAEEAADEDDAQGAEESVDEDGDEETEEGAAEEADEEAVEEPAEEADEEAVEEPAEEADEEAVEEPAEEAEEATDETDEAADAEETGAADAEDAGDDEGPGVPDSREGLEELSYRELQLLAKDADIKANLKTEELVDALAEAHGLGEDD